MDLNMKISKEYISGMTFEKEAIRKHKYTCKSEDAELNGLSFFSETVTEKKGFMDWGEGKTEYYLENCSELFNSIGELCEFHLKREAETN